MEIALHPAIVITSSENHPDHRNTSTNTTAQHINHSDQHLHPDHRTKYDISIMESSIVDSLGGQQQQQHNNHPNSTTNDDDTTTTQSSDPMMVNNNHHNASFPSLSSAMPPAPRAAVGGPYDDDSSSTTLLYDATTTTTTTVIPPVTTIIPAAPATTTAVYSAPWKLGSTMMGSYTATTTTTTTSAVAGGGGVGGNNHQNHTNTNSNTTTTSSLYHERLLNQSSGDVESVLASTCEVMGFHIAEVWLRTGVKTHQLINSHVRPTKLDDSVRQNLVDVYYGDRSADRTHKVSPSLCKKAKEAGDVIWVGADLLRSSLSNVRTAVAIPISHETSHTNMTVIFFSMRPYVYTIYVLAKRDSLLLWNECTIVYSFGFFGLFG
jgi:hypothetical protein